MRYLIAVAAVTAALAAPAMATLPNATALSSIDSVGRWIANYRAKPEPMRVPAVSASDSAATMREIGFIIVLPVKLFQTSPLHMMLQAIPA